MEKTKSCKRKMRIAIGILLLEFAYMLFMGIGGVHATDETLPTVDGKLIHSIDHVEITSEMMQKIWIRILLIESQKKTAVAHHRNFYVHIQSKIQSSRKR